MRFDAFNPPRAYQAGRESDITIKDCGRIRLEPDEQVTFLTESGAEYDVARKDWGYYATPSLNGRLARFGLRPALVKNPYDMFYLFLVEKGKEPLFEKYLQAEKCRIVTWFDTAELLKAVDKPNKGDAS